MMLSGVLLGALGLVAACGDQGPGGWFGQDISYEAGPRDPETGAPLLSGDLLTNDIAYLAHLRIIEGHLRAAIVLSNAGQMELADVHLRYARSDLYTPLDPVLAQRGVDGFARAIDRLIEVVSDGAPQREVQSAFATVLAQINAASGGIAPKTRQGFEPFFLVVSALVREAETRFVASHKRGKIVNPVHYQASWGIIDATRAMVGLVPEGRRTGHIEAFATLDDELKRLGEGLPKPTSRTRMKVDHAIFDGASQRVADVARSLH